MTPTEFLRALWPTVPAGLLVQLWQLQGRRSFYLRSPDTGDYYAKGKNDVYCGVALAAKDHGRSRRCPASQAAAIAGLWLDVDVNGGPDCKVGAAPDIVAAGQLMQEFAEPTLIVNSGYGLQGWWLFEEPWHFADALEQQGAAIMARQWLALHRDVAGFSLDGVADLARLMRVPGTFNGKGERSVPVETVAKDGPRYSRGHLLALCADAGPVDPEPSRLDPGSPIVDVHTGADRAPPAELFEALLHNSTDFERTWRHARNARWSASEYDLALCSLAAQAGWTDQQLADLIALHRRVYDPAGRKAQRADYVRRTVAKARGDADINDDVQWFRAQARGEVAA